MRRNIILFVLLPLLTGIIFAGQMEFLYNRFIGREIVILDMKQWDCIALDEADSCRWWIKK